MNYLLREPKNIFEKPPSGRARLLPSLNDSGSATLPNGSALPLGAFSNTL